MIRFKRREVVAMTAPERGIFLEQTL